MDAVSYAHSANQAQRIEKFIENPDSTSGIVTVPKTIASGETITIPAGRVAILPNVQIDGVLNVEGEVFIPSGATLGDLDNQIALKADIASPALTGNPTAPTPTAGDNSNKLATTEFVAKLIDYRGVTAMANVSTAPALSGTINFSSVSYSSESFTLTFDELMDNTDYKVQVTMSSNSLDITTGGGVGVYNKTLSGFSYTVTGTWYNNPAMVIVFGGKNI